MCKPQESNRFDAGQEKRLKASAQVVAARTNISMQTQDESQLFFTMSAGGLAEPKAARLEFPVRVPADAEAAAAHAHPQEFAFLHSESHNLHLKPGIASSFLSCLNESSCAKRIFSSPLDACIPTFPSLGCVSCMAAIGL